MPAFSCTISASLIRRACAAALLVVGAGALPAGAQTARPAASDLFARVDANRDGVVTRQEFSAARSRDFADLDTDRDGRLSRKEFVDRPSQAVVLMHLRARRFDEMDANRDGVVSRAEYVAFGNVIFGRFDVNRDGRLTRAEYRSVLARRPPPLNTAQNPQAAPPPPKFDEGDPVRAQFSALDTNGDGVVTRAELDAVRTKSFRRLDTNNDGKLSLAEAIALRGTSATKRMAQLDTDKDGTVSLVEFLEAGRVMLMRADRNGDGRLTFDEFRRAR